MATGSQRAAMASLAVFFVAGGIVLAFVSVRVGRMISIAMAAPARERAGVD
jgi:MFS-type transporter involved in bile tolerance (Atg22 family)